MKKSQKVLIALWVTASILAWWGSFSQGKKETDNLKDTKKKELAGNLETTKQEKIDPRFIWKNDISKNNNNIKDDGKNRLKTDLIKNSLDHDSIINIDANDILKIYGSEKGLKIIRQHMIIEITKLRDEKRLPKCNEDNILDQITQEYAKYLFMKKKITHIDDKWRWLKERLEEKNFEFIMCWETLWYWQWTITEIIKSRMNSPSHRNVILEKVNFTWNHYKRIWIWYYNGFWVLNLSD